LPDFDNGTRSLRSVHSTCSHFAWVISLCRAPVSINKRMALAAVRFSSTVIASTRRCAYFPGKKPVALRLLAELDAAGWVSRHAGHLPFGGEIVHVAQDHHDAVRGTSRIAVRPHARDQRDDVLGQVLVERHFPERGQDVDAQHRLTGAPASLISFEMCRFEIQGNGGSCSPNPHRPGYVQQQRRTAQPAGWYPWPWR